MIMLRALVLLARYGRVGAMRVAAEGNYSGDFDDWSGMQRRLRIRPRLRNCWRLRMSMMCWRWGQMGDVAGGEAAGIELDRAAFGADGV